MSAFKYIDSTLLKGFCHTKQLVAALQALSKHLVAFIGGDGTLPLLKQLCTEIDKLIDVSNRRLSDLEAKLSYLAGSMAQKDDVSMIAGHESFGHHPEFKRTYSFRMVPNVSPSPSWHSASNAHHAKVLHRC